MNWTIHQRWRIWWLFRNWFAIVLVCCESYNIKWNTCTSWKWVLVYFLENILIEEQFSYFVFILLDIFWEKCKKSETFRRTPHRISINRVDCFACQCDFSMHTKEYGNKTMEKKIHKNCCNKKFFLCSLLSFVGKMLVARWAHRSTWAWAWKRICIIKSKRSCCSFSYDVFLHIILFILVLFVAMLGALKWNQNKGKSNLLKFKVKMFAKPWSVTEY